MSRRRVLVLGGGCGGIAAAWALSRTPELRARFEITVVQPGFRLGGKGATGRDPTRGHAILEHGLHLWLGFYRHAFAMVRDLYAAWDAPSAGPQRSLEAAFTPLADVTLAGGPEHAPELWRLRFPRHAGRPWDDPPTTPRRLFDLAVAWARALPTALVSGDAPRDRWTVRRLRTLQGLATAVLRGLARDAARHGTGTRLWDALDEHDLRAWLLRHGASVEQADAPPIRALYDLGFAFPDGRPGPGRGAMAAGAGLRTLLQIFGAYRGAPFWRMNAGMGDTVFAPAYQVLRARGVGFRFFHRVDELRLAGLTVDAVALGVQAEVRGGGAYEPLVDVGPIRAWPDAPVAARLARVVEGDLEADDGPCLRTDTLRAGRDFDDVVLAIPSTGQRRFAMALLHASPRYRAMVEHTTAVPTVAAQWWLSRSTRQLGWRGAPPVLTGLPGLFRTWADLTPLVDAEPWRERPAALAYFCNVAPPELHPMRDRAAAGAAVAAAMRAWASGPLLDVWPGARAVGGGFDDGALHAERPGDPWATCYARANVADWERYVLSLPGSVKHRLAPGDSGFANLVLAGDWTRNVIDGGSVEGAVSSGVEAARVLAARPGA